MSKTKKPQKVSIFRCLDASTCHITQEDTTILSDCPHVGGYEDKYGWWLHVDAEDLSDPQFFEDLKAYGLSASFCKLLKFAIANQCHWIRLDGMGTVYDELDSNEW